MSPRDTSLSDRYMPDRWSNYCQPRLSFFAIAPQEGDAIRMVGLVRTLSIILLWCGRGAWWAVKWAAMVPRSTSLLCCCTPDPCTKSRRAFIMREWSEWSSYQQSYHRRSQRELACSKILSTGISYLKLKKIFFYLWNQLLGEIWKKLGFSLV